METLTRVAARYNLSFDAQNPMEETRASALLASFDAGYEGLSYEGVMNVTVLLARAHDVEMKLVAANFEYAVSVRRVFGGESRALFTVYAPWEDVQVSSSWGNDTQVKVAGRRREKIGFRALVKKPRYVIVGIDPGTTIGVAALDLEGSLVYLANTRLFGTADLIAEISHIGRPPIIASDKDRLTGETGGVVREMSLPR